MVTRLLAMPLLVVLALAGLAVPSGARAVDAVETIDTTFVTVFGQDYFGAPLDWVWRGGDAAIDVSESADGIVHVGVSGGGLAQGNRATLEFAAAPGETLAVGFYDDAEWAPFRSPGHPGVSSWTSGPTSGCSGVTTGEFTVLEIAADLSRLHIVYEVRCGGGAKVFGEIRFHVPSDDADLLVAPGSIDWPDHTATFTARTVPVTLVNTGEEPVEVLGASITTGGEAFRIVFNSCGIIEVGDSCRIGVSFRPSSPDDFTGVLTLTDTSAAVSHDVALTGTGTPADARVVTMFGNDDFVAGTGAFAWRGGDATIFVDGSVDEVVGVHVSDGGLAEGNYFTLQFAAKPGEPLTVGYYDDVERARHRSPGHPGLDVHGSGRGCNRITGRFRVLDIAPDLSRLHIVYESHCEGGAASVFGEVRYNLPGGDAEVVVAPRRIEWPDQPATTSARTVPVILVNTGKKPLTVSGAAITAGGAAFKVVSNECSTIAVGGTCKVNVRFTPSAVADYTGTLTVTDSTVAGSHTVALAGSGTVGPPNVTLAASKRAYAYGQSVVLTAKLTGGYSSKDVTFYRQYSGGSRLPIGTRQVDATGTAVFTLPAGENATFSVDWAQGDAFDTASVKTPVSAKVSLALSRYQRKSGSYYLYRPRTSIATRVVVLPGKANRCAYVTAQVKVSGAWRAVRRAACIRTASNGSASTYLPYSRYLLGRPLRFRAVFKGDSKNASAVGAWRYARYVR